MMMATKTKDAPKSAEALKEASAAQLPATVPLRLPYPTSLKDWMGYDARDWQVLTDVIFPNATTVQSIVLAVEYCRARKLDIFKKVIHIVPMRRKKADGNGYDEVDTIWPGIPEVRITATRTGVYAGKDASVFGPTKKRTFQHTDDRNGAVKKEVELEFPEWCQLTVYKIVQGLRCAFVGPKVYWEEAYATESFYSDVPNSMWCDRRNGQLEKCTEAAALRAAFPEELGGEYTAEEMHGRTLEANQVGPGQYSTAAPSDTITPPRPKQSDFDRPKADAPKAAQARPKAAQKADKEGDGRPEPPPVGEEKVRIVAPGAQAVAAKGEMRDSPKDEAPQEEKPSQAWLDAEAMLQKLEVNIADVPDEQMAEYKTSGRKNIDTFEGLTEEQKDMLRGRFVTMVLNEQQSRAKKGKRK